MKKIIAVVLTAVMVLSLCSCSFINQKAYVSHLKDNTDFSGVVMMTKNGEPVYTAASGVLKKNSDEEITPDTLFCIGLLSAVHHRQGYHAAPSAGYAFGYSRIL